MKGGDNISFHGLSLVGRPARGDNIWPKQMYVLVCSAFTGGARAEIHSMQVEVKSGERSAGGFARAESGKHTNATHNKRCNPWHFFDLWGMGTSLDHELRR